MKRRKRLDPVIAGKKGKGTPITIVVDADLLQLLDVYRASCDAQFGVLPPRAELLGGLVAKVMRPKIEEAIMIAANRAAEDGGEA